MNIETVISNLENTISGKDKLLTRLDNTKFEHGAVFAEAMNLSTIQFLRINIEELNRILDDLKLCSLSHTGDSWNTDVDRQGGSFTMDELHQSRNWK